ncbi:TRAP transporter small permease [Marinomonas hwangdonensis]|uniref:TRAP transporter small permease protein n=1 Tax=Marinomonas hwangdonensis TaxID=1053647 RepID=A0A3M8PWV8_9GAMM|nr:TRAP transporter small permease [Marinomonas hwangdonensis]RNF47170.1 TRAP transporter small permease [Marinomonas hwangdonensis]
MKFIIHSFQSTIRFLLILSLSAMVILTFGDVLGRRLFNTPIYGAHDLTEHLMALIVFCGLPLLTSVRGHLAVDLFDRFIMQPKMAWWRACISLMVAVILFLIGYQFAIAAKEAVLIQEVSQELLIPRYYLYTVMSISGFISGVAALLPESNNNMNNSDSALNKGPLSGESGL